MRLIKAVLAAMMAAMMMAGSEIKAAEKIEEETRLFFPFVAREVPPRLGIQLDGAIREYGWAPWIIPNRLYVIPLRWEDAQPEAGDPVMWPDYVLDNLRELKGQTVMISVKGAPEWARLWPEVVGSPVKREAWEAMAGFLVQAAAELNPWGFGLFNEPDVPIERSADLRYYGGWLHEEDDPFEAGKFYGEFAGYVYSRFKERCPDGPKLIVLELCCDLEFARGAYDGGLAGDLVGLHKYIKQNGDFEAVYRQAEIVSRITGLQPIVTETNLTGNGEMEQRAAQAAYMQFLHLRQGRNMDEWYAPLSVVVYALGNDWEGADLVHQGQAMEGYWEWAR